MAESETAGLEPMPFDLDTLQLQADIDPNTPVFVDCILEDGTEIQGRVRDGGKVDWELQFYRGDAVDIDGGIQTQNLALSRPKTFRIRVESKEPFRLHGVRLGSALYKPQLLPAP